MYPLDGNLVFVATDGFRLAEKRIQSKNLPEFVHVLIPVRNASEIIRIFEGVDEVERGRVAQLPPDCVLVVDCMNRAHAKPFGQTRSQ
jgi:hypothetical protein